MGDAGARDTSPGPEGTEPEIPDVDVPVERRSDGRSPGDRRVDSSARDDRSAGELPARHPLDGPAADAIDELVGQWDRERPELVFDAMATVARLGRVADLMRASVEAVLAAHGLTVADFDVLATLRRSGEPFVLRPSDLSRQLLLSPAGMTGRLDRLAGAGLVDRTPDPGDRRSWLIGLTDSGRRTVDAAVVDHLANEERLLAPLAPGRRQAFDDALRELLAQFR